MEEEIFKKLNEDLDLILNVLNGDKVNDIQDELKTKIFIFKKLYMEYLIIILRKVYSLIDNNNGNKENIYKLIDKIFLVLLKQKDDNKKQEKIASIFYIICIIQNKLKTHFPEFLMTNIINYFSKIDTTNLLIKGLLIIINKNNLSKENVSKIFPLIKQNINIFKNLDNDISEYFIYHSISIYTFSQSPEFSKLLQILFSNIKNGRVLCNYILFFQDFALNNRNENLYYKFIKIILKSECFSKINITRNEESDKIINRFFTIISLNDNNEKTKYISIRALDEFFLKQKIISYGKRLTQENDKDFLFIKEFFNYCNNIKMTTLTLRSYLLCIFQNENIFNQLKYIKYGIDKVKLYVSNVHQNIDIICNIFNVLEKIYEDEELFLNYKSFLYNFCNSTIELCKNTNSFKQEEFKYTIFSSYKLLGNIFETLILYSITNQNFNFRLEELCDIIDRSLYFFRRAFYFQLIINLGKQIFSLSKDNEISILETYINSLIKCILEKIRFDLYSTIDKSLIFNYYINVKNAIYSFIDFLEYISFRAENKQVGEIIIDKFLNFINENIENSILYVRDIFQDNKSIAERILDTLILYYVQFEKGKENIEIIKKYYYHDDICIFLTLDFQKNNNYKIKQIKKIEKILEKEEEVTKNTYFLSLKVICKLLSIDLSSIKNDDFKKFLQKMINDIIKGINDNKNDIKRNNFIGGDYEYNNFKEKIIQNMKKNKEINIEFLQKNLINEKIISKDKKENENKFKMNQNNKFEFKEDKDDYSNILLKIYKDNSNIELWYDDIKNYGLLSVHKTKSFLLKRLFSNMYLNKFFLNKSLDKLEEPFKEKTNNILEIKRFHEPKKIKNYITKNYIKPFLKLHRKFYQEQSYEISHSYAINFKEEIKKEEKILLKYNESTYKIYCELLIPEGSVFCSILIFKGFLIIKSEKEIKIKPRSPQNMFSSVKYINKKKFIIIPFEYIFEIITRRFLYIWQACEIFTKDNKSYLLNFLNKNQLINFYEILNKFKGKEKIKIIQNSVETFKELNLLKEWQNSKISNFDFINLLNKYSSRSYNDLDQYPIFPWIYDSYKKLNERNNNLRKFEYPISAQTSEKRKEILDKYLIKCETTEFVSHHQIHYSTSAFIYFYLLRLSPITEIHIGFQGNAFDNPDRLFNGFSDVKELLERYNDNRELIPEIFYFDELYYNINLNFFGIKSSNKMIVHNIILPENCFNSSHFIYIQRMNFESNEIKNKISKWIDNIFGYNQYNENNLVDSFNVFNWETYEKLFKKKYSKGEIPEDKLNDELTYIILFGECPAVLFNKKIEETDFDNEEEKIFDNISLKLKKAEDNSVYTSKKLNNIEENSEILILQYSKKKIVILDNKHCISVFMKANLKFISKYDISKSYSYITQNSFIVYDKSNIIINSNYFDELIEVFHDNTKYAIKVNNLISCLCIINENSFYAGTVEGLIMKYEFKENDFKNIKKIGNEYICHNNEVVWKIIYNENLNCIISVGGDHFIYIRNAYSFELINAFPLESNEIYNIYLNEFNNIYTVNIVKNTIVVYTLNGMKICKEKEDINENYLCFPYNNKLFYFDDNTKTLNEICPVYFQKKYNEIPIRNKNISNSIIKFLKFNENENCFDFWGEDKNVFRVYLGEKINKRKESNTSQEPNSNKSEEGWFNFSFWDRGNIFI